MGTPWRKVSNYVLMFAILRVVCTKILKYVFVLNILEPIFSSNNKASRIYEKLHCDLWGVYTRVSSFGAHYFLTIVDDYSRAVCVYSLVNKIEVFCMFISFIVMVGRQFSQTIKVVQSDHETEFNCLVDDFDENRILS